jgi:hypothetical protein
MMTKQDFVAVARVLKARRDGAPRAAERKVLDDTARDLATYFKAANPHFQRDRFLNACGIEQVQQ